MPHLWKAAADVTEAAPPDDVMRSPKGAPGAPFSKSTNERPDVGATDESFWGVEREAGSKGVFWGFSGLIGVCERATEERGETERKRG